VLFHSISYGILMMILYGCYIISVIAWVLYHFCYCMGVISFLLLHGWYISWS